MTPEQHLRCSEVFFEVCSLSDHERPAALARLCGDDAALRAEVESLLAYNVAPGEMTDPAPLSQSALNVASASEPALPRDFGPFRIQRLLGEGGMGVVFLARDTRLDRNVAIKALPAHLSNDPARLARFEREAKALASLNHSNIGAIYGIEEAHGQQYLVLEYIEGETLDAYLQRRPLAPDEAIDIAVHIAEALEAAHDKGVIHRDLKPGNIMVTADGAVKVLDFGLARTTETNTSTLAGEDSPTVTSPMPVQSPTIPGAIMGTAGYMSPEQARGKIVDKRSDIFSFGCVLYEMLTGAKLFHGESVADVLGATLHKTPDLTVRPLGTLPMVQHVLRRCLERDKQRRYRDIGDVRIELDAARTDPMGWMQAGAAVATRLRSPGAVVRRVAFVLLVIGLAITVGAIGERFVRSEPQPPQMKRFGIGGLDMPMDPVVSLAISPKGDRIVVRERDETGRTRLYVRAIDSLEFTPIRGSEEGRLPFFSPDGDHVAFFAVGELKVASLSGGTVRTICETPLGYSGGAWMRDDTIVFAAFNEPTLYQVSSFGDAIQPINLDLPEDFHRVVAPSPLPNGDGVLCVVEQRGRFHVAVFSRRSGKTQVLVENGFHPVYSASGHVVYQQGDDGPLMAIPFDARRLLATGRPFPVISHMGTRNSFQVQSHAIAADGTLAFIAPQASEKSELAWMNAAGEVEHIVEIAAHIDMPRLSRDGQRVAYRLPAPDCDVWVYDLARGTTALVTRGGDNHGVVWSSDDRHIMTFRRGLEEDGRASIRGVGSTVMLRSDGVGEAQVLHTPSLLNAWTLDMTGDGRFALLQTHRPESGGDVDLLDIETGTVDLFLNTRFDESAARFSPSASHIVYVSNESGRPEIYMQPFPSLDSRIQISADGGIEPAWSREGDVLYFRSGNSLFSVEIQTEPDLVVGRPVEVLSSATFAGAPGTAGYDVADDGRFLMVRAIDENGNRVQVEVMLNWFSEVNRLDPSRRRN